MEDALSAYVYLRRRIMRWYDENLVTFTQCDSPGSHLFNKLCDAEVSQSIREHNACLDEQTRLLPLPELPLAEILYVIG
jgi:hypothetical protein